MSLIPRLLRPSVLIRRKAMYAGFLGPSTFWKVVGVFVFGKSTIAKVFGRQPEVIDVSTLGPGRVMQLVTAKPMTKRRRRKLAKRGVVVPTRPQQEALAQIWASDQAAERAS
jgi:hypothetical protein